MIDVNAVSAIQAIGYLRDFPRPTGQDNSLPTWDRQLHIVGFGVAYVPALSAYTLP